MDSIVFFKDFGEADDARVYIKWNRKIESVVRRTVVDGVTAYFLLNLDNDTILHSDGRFL